MHWLLWSDKFLFIFCNEYRSFLFSAIRIYDCPVTSLEQNGWGGMGREGYNIKLCAPFSQKLGWSLAECSLHGGSRTDSAQRVLRNQLARSPVSCGLQTPPLSLIVSIPIVLRGVGEGDGVIGDQMHSASEVLNSSSYQVQSLEVIRKSFTKVLEKRLS